MFVMCYRRLVYSCYWFWLFYMVTSWQQVKLHEFLHTRSAYLFQISRNYDGFIIIISISYNHNLCKSKIIYLYVWQVLNSSLMWIIKLKRRL